MNRYFSKEDTFYKWPISIREMQIKPKVRYLVIPTRMAIIKEIITRVGENVEKLELS